MCNRRSSRRRLIKSGITDLRKASNGWWIAEERALGRDHRFDDLSVQSIARLAAASGRSRSPIEFRLSCRRTGVEAALDKILLVRVQEDRAVLVQQPADRVEVPVRYRFAEHQVAL